MAVSSFRRDISPMAPSDSPVSDGSAPVGAAIHHRVPMLDDGGHDRPPAPPELVGHPRRRTSQLTHLAARLGARSAGQRDLGVEMVRRLGPRPAVAQRLPTPPPALYPHQPRRSAETRPISDRHPNPMLGLSAGA